MSVELATAYVSLVPSLKGAQASIATELGQAGDAGGEKAGAGFKSKFSGAIKGVGVAAGAIVAAGFLTAFNQSASAGTLQAKLGISPGEAASLAKTSASIYAQNWGDSLGDVTDSVAAVKSGLRGIVSDSDIGDLTTQALAFKQTFGIETADSIRAVSQLVKTGLAKNAQEAFDILTTGEQNGADKAGDLIDTFNEYGVQLQKLGVDGPTALGLISQGLQNGARDSDLVADSLKEFSIRAVDGSTLTAAGFKAVGLDAKAMAEQIGHGGKDAAAGLQATLDGLRGIKDPVKRAQAATALFGTQAEDLGVALYSLNPATASTQAGMKDLEGSTGRLTDAIGTTSNPLESLKRSLIGTVTSLASGLIPAVQVVSPLIGKLGPYLLIVGGAVAAVAVGMSLAATATGIYAVVTGEATASTALQTIAVGIQKTVLFVAAGATKAMAAAQWLLNAAMSANPIVLVVLAIAALVAGVIIAYNKVGWLRDLVQGAFHLIQTVISNVVSWVSQHWPLLLAILTGPFGLAVKFIVDHWNGIVTFLSGIPGKIAKIASAMWAPFGAGLSFVWEHIIKPIIDAILAAINSVRDALSALSNFFTGGSGSNLTSPALTAAQNRARDAQPHQQGNQKVRALGGPVTAGEAYTVGERGRETFVPDVNGRIIPNGAGGAAPNVYVTVQIDGKEIESRAHVVIDGVLNQYATALAYP